MGDLLPSVTRRINMPKKDKVWFGLSKIHFIEYELDEDGKARWGAEESYHLPGAVNMSYDAETGEVKFRADNCDYYVNYSDNGGAGELEMALFPDDFKTRFLNYIPTAKGGVAQVKNKKKKRVAMMFQGEGDETGNRGIFYNVALGSISRERKTTEETTEPVTAKLAFTVTGDNYTGIVQQTFDKYKEGYDTIFSDPPLPELPLVFTKSTDTTVDAGKVYYTVEAAAVEDPDAVELPLYYEKSGTGSNASYALTTDKSVDSSKTYYTLEGTEVSSPTGDPSTSDYYEAAELDMR